MKEIQHAMKKFVGLKLYLFTAFTSFMAFT